MSGNASGSRPFRRSPRVAAGLLMLTFAIVAYLAASPGRRFSRTDERTVLVKAAEKGLQRGDRVTVISESSQLVGRLEKLTARVQRLDATDDRAIVRWITQILVPQNTEERFGSVYLVWTSDREDSVSRLAELMRAVVMFFDVSAISGTHGRMLKLTEKKHMAACFRDVMTINSDVPVLVFLKAEHFPLKGVFRFNNVSWTTLGRRFNVLVSELGRVASDNGVILTDDPVELKCKLTGRAVNGLVHLFRDQEKPIGGGALVQVFPSTHTRALHLQKTPWQRGDAVCFPQAGRFYMWLTATQVQPTDQVGFQVDVGLEKDRRYKLRFEWFNGWWGKVLRPSVFIRARTQGRTIWEHGIGSDVPCGWNREAIDLQPTKDGQTIEFLIAVKDNPDRWGWGPGSTSMFRFIRAEPVP